MGVQGLSRAVSGIEVQALGLSRTDFHALPSPQCAHYAAGESCVGAWAQQTSSPS